ncbi:hypothetical protein D3C85_1368870 [compost metagenome]
MPEFKHDFFNSIGAEKTSFAYYLATNAVLLYAEAIQRLAAKLENADIEDSVFEAKKTLWQLISEHESLTDEYYKCVLDEPA